MRGYRKFVSMEGLCGSCQKRTEDFMFYTPPLRGRPHGSPFCKVQVDTVTGGITEYAVFMNGTGESMGITDSWRVVVGLG